MIWYNMTFKDGVCEIYKSVELGKGLAFKKIFEGSRKECTNYCEKNNIKLGKNNKKVITT